MTFVFEELANDLGERETVIDDCLHLERKAIELVPQLHTLGLRVLEVGAGCEPDGHEGICDDLTKVCLSRCNADLLASVHKDSALRLSCQRRLHVVYDVKPLNAPVACLAERL